MFVQAVSVSSRHRRGVIIIWLALCLVVIVGIVAINVDGGRVLDERRVAQASADAAALAGANNLYSNYWEYHGVDVPGTAALAAVNSAGAYPASAVTVNIPPLSGSFAGQPGYVEVIIVSNLGVTFGSIFTGNDMQVTARAVARGAPMKIGVILLESSGANAFLNQSLAFTLVNAPLIVDSTDPSAFTQESFNLVVASRIDITGGMTNPGGAMMLGQIRTGVSPTPDPLVFLPVPSSVGAPIRSSAPMTINSLVPTILQPGVYQGGLNITGASIVTMLPGVYIMQGGGFQVSGLAVVTGLEVTVYNTTSTTYASGPISVTGLGNIVLTAPLSSTYQGISLFQDRSLSTAITIGGSGVTALTGMVYAASAPVNLSNTLPLNVDILGGAYVVSSMKVSGIGAINVDIGLNPPRIPDVRLVE